ncbi:GDSL esterase/lipase APG-like [Aegilops tauschii subsp. strangulata]|nr:GDSL esterase/lipase APG-like [Aegilops tauschii subsp. strangulata]
MMGVRVATGKALMILVAVSIICAGGGVVASPAAAEEVPLVPAVYVFGDSTMDVGNLGNFTPSPPYGVDLPLGIVPRFSNGYNMADSISRLLGFDMSPPAYLSLTPETSVEILKGLGGVNYASGGSGILDITHNADLPLSKQVEYFAATKAKMIENGTVDIDALLSKSLFLISDGGNDMFDFIFKGRSIFEFPSFHRDLLSNYTKYVQTLYGLGARRFGLIDVPPVGCVPMMRYILSKAGLDMCERVANGLAEGFNKKLSIEMAKLADSLPGMRYSVGSSYKLVTNYTAHPEAAGFDDVKSACCGGGMFGMETLCVPDVTTCPNHDDHLFWDAVHCTQATSNKGAEAIFAAPVGLNFTAPINFKQLLLDDQPTPSAVNLLTS